MTLTKKKSFWWSAKLSYRKNIFLWCCLNWQPNFFPNKVFFTGTENLKGAKILILSFKHDNIDCCLLRYITINISRPTLRLDQRKIYNNVYFLIHHIFDSGNCQFFNQLWFVILNFPLWHISLCIWVCFHIKYRVFHKKENKSEVKFWEK